jgi:hypothetical protein
MAESDDDASAELVLTEEDVEDDFVALHPAKARTAANNSAVKRISFIKTS